MAYTNASRQPVKLDINKISQITADLNLDLNKPKPEGWFFKWFSRQKIESDNLRTRELYNYIETVRQANFEKAYLDKQEELSPQIIEEILLGDLQRARLLREKELIAHKAYLEEIKDEQAMRRLMLEEKIAEIDGKINLNSITQGQSRLLDRIVNEIDINNITPSQAFVLVKCLNPNTEANVDFATQELMINAQVEDIKAGTLKKLHEAESQRAKAELDSFTTMMTKKDFND